MTADPQRAKRPVSAALAGPYGHPFHPILVTVPIGAWVASVVFDLASHVAGDPDALAYGARWLIAIGVLGALAAATVGFLDFLAIPAGTPAFRIGLTHLSLNLAVTVAFALDFWWRGTPDGAVPIGPLVLSLVALATLSVSGYLGGKLAYRYGVRVADESTQAEGFRR
ncbi:DUF2231 domain-containing protein [Nocardia sp. NPDC005746]|uniref:DUF2231 domain-containing protein n=1 Tax=unclassified Nocardia TaxID=2637762 RepID=UPI0033FECB2A